MKAIKSRPFAFSCCIFIIFSYLFYFCPQIITVATALITLILGTALLFSGKRARFISIYLVVPVLLSSLISFAYFNLYYNKVTSYANKTSSIQFVLLDKGYESETFSSYTVKIETIDGKKAGFKSILTTEAIIDAELFSVHSCKADIGLPNESHYGFSPKSYNRSQGIFLASHASDDVVSLMQTRKLFPTYYLSRTNRFFSDVLDQYMPDGKASFSKALLLGDTSVLGSKDNLNFRLLGLSHALAVSGTHLTILIGSIDYLLSKLRLSKSKRCVIVILLTLFYAGLTGFSPAVKRSAVMFIISAMSFLITRSNDPLTSLCFSGAFLCALEPHALFDVGLQLSFLSTMGIIVFASPAIHRLDRLAFRAYSAKMKLMNKIISPILFGIAPILFSLPVIWLSFGEIALISPISNIIFSPLVTLIMYSCPILLTVSFLPPVANLVAFIPSYTSSFILFLAEKMAKISPVVSINYGFTAFIIGSLVISLVILMLKNFKNKLVYIIPFILTFLAFAVCITVYNHNNADKIKAIYTSNTDGDSFLVINNGKALLCDLSGISYQTAKSGEYYLGENHLTKLDTYLITEYHGRGTDTLERLSCLTRIDRLMLPLPLTNTEKAVSDKLVDVAEENDIECIFYDSQAADQIEFGDVRLDVKNLYKNQTNAPSSICVTLSTDSQKLSYIGKGCYTTAPGKQHLTQLFNRVDSVLFGNYGRESEQKGIMSLFYRPSINVFFPSDNLYRSYRNTVSPDADVRITGNYFEFELG
ncbi:MAG: ComEC/Rec2 family competence protein [Clostridia bacterium]|nr:ComEC/Rec2 family competence protein [Clostridia bacterium]